MDSKSMHLIRVGKERKNCCSKYILEKIWIFASVSHQSLIKKKNSHAFPSNVSTLVRYNYQNKTTILMFLLNILESVPWAALSSYGMTLASPSQCFDTKREKRSLTIRSKANDVWCLGIPKRNPSADHPNGPKLISGLNNCKAYPNHLTLILFGPTSTIFICK
jgi:hypothetical protein